MLQSRDPDLMLAERMLAAPALDDARASLEYWQRRLSALPLYRRGARREAKEMAIRWQERVRAAEQARFEASPVGRLLTALGGSSFWPRWMRFRQRGLFMFAWDLVPRPAKLVAGSVLAGWLLMSAAAAAAAAAVAMVLQLA